MPHSEQLQSPAAQQLNRYLLSNHLRQTSERYAILEAVGDIPGMFTAEDLENIMAQRHFPVSRSTIYASLQLLVEANLVMRHPFSSASSLYECVKDASPRCYQICNRCHRITQIKSKELNSTLNIYQPRSFSVSHRVAYVYGVCPKCASAMARALKKLKRQPTQ